MLLPHERQACINLLSSPVQYTFIMQNHVESLFGVSPSALFCLMWSRDTLFPLFCIYHCCGDNSLFTVSLPTYWHIPILMSVHIIASTVHDKNQDSLLNIITYLPVAF